MARSNKFDYQAAIQSKLIAAPEGLTLDELLERSGFDVDRSTLFRHLVRLIEQGKVERIGKARASRYRPLDMARIDTVPEQSCMQLPAAQAPPGSPEAEPPKALLFPPSSAAQAVSRSDLGEPDSMPVATPHYAMAVKKAVRTVVREWKRLNAANLQIYLSLLVAPEHLNEVSATVRKELAGLNADKLDEFGLTPAEFAAYTPPAAREAAREQEG